MTKIPLEYLPATYEDLFKENVTDPIHATMYLFQDKNTPSRVWREGRAEKGCSFEVYPNDVPGQKPCESKTRGRQGVPPGHDVASWRRVDKELYPPPAPLDEGTVQVVLSRGARLRSSRP